MANLYLMCGPSGAGKSTWIANHIHKNDVCISRDNIRFVLVAEDEPYFSRENEVFREFIYEINKALAEGRNVYADATHLNESARNRVLDKLNLNGVQLYAVNFETTLENCIANNNKRKGRRFVPISAIENMYNAYTPAGMNEKYHYNLIDGYKMS